MIPFNRPYSTGSELEILRQAIESAKLSGDGPINDRCQQMISELSGGGSSFMTPSCTAALELAALLIDLKPGDEVIMPSYTFVSTANAVVLRGAVPVFVDIRPDTLNIDETLIEAAIGKRTKAITAVHYAGVPAEMDPLTEIAKQYNLSVTEDAAQALGSRYRERPAGSLGDLAAFSFHETKNIISGEGGALTINLPQLVERAEVIREKGTNRRNLLRGLVDKYTWIDVGSSYLTSELVAAYLLAQLQAHDTIRAGRLAHWNFYNRELKFLENEGFRLPFCPPWCQHNGHIFYLIAPTASCRDQLITRLKNDGILAPFHYIPLHSAPAGQRFGRTSGRLTITTDVSTRLLRLPLYQDIGDLREIVVERLSFHAKKIQSGN